jgi:hypothetical protein
VVGTVDIIGDYYHGYQLGLADLAGQLGAAYEIVSDLRASADDHARRRVLFSSAPQAPIRDRRPPAW